MTICHMLQYTVFGPSDAKTCLRVNPIKDNTVGIHQKIDFENFLVAEALEISCASNMVLASLLKRKTVFWR